MSKALVGYARCSTDKQDLAAQRAALIKLGVDPKRIYTDHGGSSVTSWRAKMHRSRISFAMR